MGRGPLPTFAETVASIMPPNMITRDSSLGSEAVTLPEGRSVRYYIFTTVYNARDIYCFVSQDALDGLPTTRLGMHKIADLCIYCEDWSIAVKNRDDKVFLETLVGAFQNLLTVDEVHAL